MLRLACQAGWLKPRVQGNRLTLFDYDDCLACWKRVCVEGKPLYGLPLRKMLALSPSH